MFLMCLTMPLQASKPLKPWKKGAYETQTYRNVFVEMGYKPEAVNAKLDEIFNDLFYGPNKIYFEVRRFDGIHFRH